MSHKNAGINPKTRDFNRLPASAIGSGPPGSRCRVPSAAHAASHSNVHRLLWTSIRTRKKVHMDRGKNSSSL